jgi:hypothetical protein
MLSRHAPRKIVFGAMRKPTVHGLAEHAPRQGAKKEDFPKPWCLGILTSFVNSHLIWRVRMQYLNYPAKHFRSVGERVRTAFIIILRLSLYPSVTSCIGARLVIHLGFKNGHNRHGILRCAKTSVGHPLLPGIAPSKSFPERFSRPDYFAIHWATSEA